MKKKNKSTGLVNTRAISTDSKIQVEFQLCWKQANSRQAT